MRVFKAWSPVPKHQTDVVPWIVSAVQNQWYTMLDTTPRCRLISLVVQVINVSETLEVRFTVDGVVMTGTVDAVQGTDYLVLPHHSNENMLLFVGDSVAVYRPFTLEGESVKLEIRKTTNAGDATLLGLVKYATWT